VTHNGIEQWLNAAVREGARQASTGNKTTAQVQQVVVNYMAANKITITTHKTTSRLFNVGGFSASAHSISLGGFGGPALAVHCGGSGDVTETHRIWHVPSTPARKGSDQVKWLSDDLAAHKTDCVLAYFHIARFSSGAHGSDPIMADVWKVLYDAGVDVILSSHDHDYERFAPQDDRGKPDPEKGIREFVVGTGGGGVYEFKKTQANSEVRNNKAYGVLKMTLKPGKYDWEFVRAVGEQFRDAGSGTCSPAK
jgi:hypothetical protein